MFNRKGPKNRTAELKPATPAPTAKLNVTATVANLNRMTVTDLRERYAEVFGEATRSFHKIHLVRRIIWRMQAMAEGGLSERARQRAKELACEADLRVGEPHTRKETTMPNATPPTPLGLTVTEPFRVSADARLPMPGAVIQRLYKGQMIRVRVLPKGFEFEGEIYRSLSAIAKKVTGAHWNGQLFFGLTRKDQDGAA